MSFKLKQAEVNAQKITDISPTFSGHDITLEDGSTYYAHSVPDDIGPGDYFIPLENVVYDGYDSDFVLMEKRQFESMFVEKQTKTICRRCGYDISPVTDINSRCRCHPSKVQPFTIDE